jgi:protein-tyrosine phosphatase
MIKILFSILIITIISGCAEKKVVEKKPYWAKPVKELEVENLHKVDEKLYRSAQPDEKEFKQLYNFGVRYDLNLRQFHDDKDKLKGSDIKYHHIPINTSKMSYEQLVEAVAYLSQTKQKTLVHCLHGSDRTGTVVAGYRIAVNGWDKEKAIDEFINGGFGFHSFWFVNLPELLRSIDVDKFKSDVNNYKFEEGTF